MAANDAVRYLKIPADIDVTGENVVNPDPLKDDRGRIIRNPTTGLPMPAEGPEILTFAKFFEQFLIGRIPIETDEQTVLVMRLREIFRKCVAGEEIVLHAGEWQAMVDALPPCMDAATGRPGVLPNVYGFLLPYYRVLRNPPKERPKDWRPLATPGGVTVEEPPEPALPALDEPMVGDDSPVAE